jgi:hypothetical protein
MSLQLSESDIIKAQITSCFIVAYAACFVTYLIKDIDQKVDCPLVILAIAAQLAAYNYNLYASFQVCIGVFILVMLTSRLPVFAHCTEEIAHATGCALAQTSQLKMKLPKTIKTETETIQVEWQICLIPGTVETPCNPETRMHRFMAADNYTLYEKVTGHKHVYKRSAPLKRPTYIHLQWADNVSALKSMSWMTPHLYTIAAKAYFDAIKAHGRTHHVAILYNTMDSIPFDMAVIDDNYA